MKINRTNAEMKPEDIYQLGNIIKDSCGMYYLAVLDRKADKYALVDLKNDEILPSRFATLKELAETYYNSGDRVMNATLTVED